MTNASPRSDPRSPGRPREFDIDDAIDRAVDVFRERGYQATSISDLVAGMGLARGSVYKAFKDKQALFLAAYDRYTMARMDDWQRVMGEAGSGRDRLGAILRLYAQLASRDDGRKGCLVVATAVELTVIDAEIARRVTDSFERLRHLVARLIAEGKQDGSIGAGIDEDATAELMLCLMQGMRVVGKTAPDQAMMTRVVDRAMAFLD